MALVLKILSGPHIGAEAELADGRYILGSGDDCDLSLTDSALAARHVKILVESNKVFVSPLQGRLRLEGDELAEEGRQVENFKILVAGGTAFCFGPADSNWPQLSLNQLVEIPQSEEPSPQDKSGQQSETEDEQADKSGNSFRQLFGMLIVLSLVVLFAFGLWELSRYLIRPLTMGEKLAKTIQILHSGDFKWLNARLTESNGSLEVYGRVAGIKRAQELQFLIGGLDFKIDLDIGLSKQVASHLQSFIKKQGAHLKVHTTSRGEIYLTGYLGSKKILNNLLEKAKKQIKHLGVIKASIVTFDLVKPELAAILASDGFWGGVKLISEDYGIGGEAILHESDIKLWQSLPEDLKEMFGVRIPLNIKVSMAKSRKGNPLNLEKNKFRADLSWKKVRQVRLGQAPYFIDGSGRKHELGQMLPCGYRVSRISQMGVVLMRGQDMLFLPARR